LKNQEKADLNKLSEEKSDLKSQLLRERQTTAVQTFVKQLRDKSKVSVNVAVIQYPAS
jgi:hypothetical protein